MTDSEKLALIDAMIADYWEFVPFENEKRSAETLVVSIGTVLNFKGKE